MKEWTGLMEHTMTKLKLQVARVENSTGEKSFALLDSRKLQQRERESFKGLSTTYKWLNNRSRRCLELYPLLQLAEYGHLVLGTQTSNCYSNSMRKEHLHVLALLISIGPVPPPSFRFQPCQSNDGL
jgi:hypothetical protein